MKITNLLLCLFLLGLSGLSFAEQGNDLSSRESDPQVSSKNSKAEELVNKLKSALNKKWIYAADIVAYEKYIAQIKTNGDPDQTLSIYEERLQRCKRLYTEAAQQYKKLGKKLQALKAQAFAEIDQENFAEPNLQELRLRRPELLQHALGNTELLVAMPNFLARIFKEAADEKKLVRNLTNISQKRKELNYKNSALEELIKLVESTDGLRNKLPTLKQVLREVATAYQKLNEEFEKKGKKLISRTQHSFYWVAYLDVKAKSESGVAPNDLVASLKDHSHIRYIKEIVKIFYNLDDEVTQRVKKSVFLEKFANDYEIPANIVPRGAINTLSILLRSALEAKDKYAAEAATLDEIIDQVKIAGMKDRLPPLRKALKEATTKSENFSQLSDHLGSIIKGADPVIYEKIMAKNHHDASEDNVNTLLRHRPGKITSGEVDALKNIFQQADQIKESEANITKYAQEVIKRFDLEDALNLKDIIKAAAIKSKSKDCAANVLPLKAKGKKK
ncbi:MAG: hypothetical protein J6Y94_06330 [Bacteriovoracaceae bacterium]|nr:hypothetical protein [Bacteriovoracaceae bacterium]